MGKDDLRFGTTFHFALGWKHISLKLGCTTLHTTGIENGSNCQMAIVLDLNWLSLNSSLER